MVVVLRECIIQIEVTDYGFQITLERTLESKTKSFILLTNL